MNDEEMKSDNIVIDMKTYELIMELCGYAMETGLEGTVGGNKVQRLRQKLKWSLAKAWNFERLTKNEKIMHLVEELSDIYTGGY